MPANGERRWGTNASNLLIALAQNALSKAGGNFTLTADANFGAAFGLVVKYLKSVSSNISTTGVVRLANNEGIGFRNAANLADKILKLDASDKWAFGASALSEAELGYLSGVTSAIQTQLNAKVGTSDTIGINRGGTGQTSANAALNALLPTQTGNANKVLGTNGTDTAWAAVATTVTTTRGDIIKRGVSADERLALGASGTFLRSGGTDPAWSAIGATDYPLATNSARGAINYYLEDDATLASVYWDPNGGGANGSNFAVKCTRVGRTVTLQFPREATATGVGGTTNTLALSTALPAAFRPASTQSFPVFIFSNAAVEATPGLMEITSVGGVSLLRAPTGINFGAGQCGLERVCVTYTV